MTESIFAEKELDHIYDFLPPNIVKFSGEYRIWASLPKRYNDFAPHIWKNGHFRNDVRESLEEGLIKATSVDEITLTWTDIGLMFETPPAALIVVPTASGFCYTSKDIGDSQRANVLQQALTIYQVQLYKLMIHANLDELSKFKEPSPKDMRVTISLKYEKD